MQINNSTGKQTVVKEIQYKQLSTHEYHTYPAAYYTTRSVVHCIQHKHQLGKHYKSEADINDGTCYSCERVSVRYSHSLTLKSLPFTYPPPDDILQKMINIKHDVKGQHRIIHVCWYDSFSSSSCSASIAQHKSLSQLY